MAATHSPVNGWLGSIFESVETFHLHTNNTIAPPRKTRIRDSYIEALKYMPDNKRRQLDVQYSNVKVTNGNRTNNQANGTATNTDENIKDRAKFRNMQIRDSHYVLPLSLIEPFYNLDTLFHNPIRIKLTMVTDMNQLVEITDKRNDDDILKSHATFKYHKHPFIVYPLFYLTGIATTTFNNMLMSNTTYRLGSVFDDTDLKTDELTVGKKTHNFNFQNINKQFSFLLLSLKPRESIEHSSPYNSYDIEQSSLKVEQVRFQNIQMINKSKNPVFDLKEELIKRNMHKAYLAYVTGGCSVDTPDRLASGDINSLLPTHTSYFTDGHYLVFDLRNSGGYTDKLDPIIRNDNELTMEFTLKDAIPNGTTLVSEVIMVSEGEYSLVQTKHGQKIVYATYSITNR